MEENERTEAIHRLEMQHQKGGLQAQLLEKDEEARRLKVRIVLLRDEVATIKDYIAQKDVSIEALNAQYLDVCGQVEALEQQARSHENLMRAGTRELATLKAELLAVNSMSSDSAKLLSEKLALSRELNTIKPELEHLQAQVTQQKGFLAEKLALERQLNTLEVELANEKRATQRAQQRQETNDNDVVEELRQQVQELEKKLTAEKRAAKRTKQEQNTKQDELEEELRQRVEELEKQLADEKRAAGKAKSSQEKAASGVEDDLRRQLEEANKSSADQKKEHEKNRKQNERDAVEAQNYREMLEQKLMEFKAKLRETRAELKECKAELEKAQQDTATVTMKAAAKAADKLQARCKRRAGESGESETLMSTPKNEETRTKRPLKPVQAQVGEKSTFSITPLLNKTMNLSENSIQPGGNSDQAAEEDNVAEEAQECNDEAAESSQEMVPEHTPVEPVEEPATTTRAAKPKKKPSVTASTKEPKVRGRPKTKALGDASTSKKNMPASLPQEEEPTAEEKTAEEPAARSEADKENRPSEAPKATKRVVQLKPKNAVADVSVLVPEPDAKKKKRKLLGASTLFDNEDIAVSEVPIAVAPAAIKRAKTQLGVARGLGRTQLGGPGPKNAFAGKTFSPLKRERRGVGASFLA